MGIKLFTFSPGYYNVHLGLRIARSSDVLGSRKIGEEIRFIQEIDVEQSLKPKFSAFHCGLLSNALSK